MVTACSYILIVASVIVFGYSLSLLLDNFGAMQKKVADYREMLSEFDEPLGNTRWVNSIQNVSLLLGYVSAAYFAGFAYWVLSLVTLKFTLSCLLSDRFHCLILNNQKTVSKSIYRWHKLDALSNVLICFFMLLAMVL
ncbi:MULTISPECIES: hypothetical protein [Hallerella]|uniref:Uncharacterized protein n=1 Tax=Hallerella succinigenes TaxID=1896222 RepID=A0A2M9AA85_9BACT|nr:MULTISPECIES: hypothetical protein [Hallerella]MBS7392581.1 hypothetical protein [Fibrobacter sp.]MCI6874176.1 hypothetical protein [Hallerella sp.]MDD6091877.1 hypothetical protein [Hallerella succinigenes]MDY5029373.1 hypothetical protein [Hallerella succinigenes]PJJ42600.1 hypothetical protein BGX16_2637 [Hallerella succinigenes]